MKRECKKLPVVLSLAALALSAGCGHMRMKPGQGLLQGGAAAYGHRPGRSTATASRPDLQLWVPGTRVVSTSGFAWPLAKGTLSSFFGARDSSYHEGIDIRAPSGTPVYSAREGVVIYSGRGIRGYGNVVIIKHPGAFATVYAHNKLNTVRRGDHVKRGGMVARVGATGRATGPHLHFEVRRGELPQDPLMYLPRAGGAGLDRMARK